MVTPRATAPQGRYRLRAPVADELKEASDITSGGWLDAAALRWWQGQAAAGVAPFPRHAPSQPTRWEGGYYRG